MEAAFGIIASLVQLAIFIGLIVFVVKFVAKKGSSSAEGSGISIRRFFQYVIMLVILVIAAFGVIGLIDAVASAGSTVTRDTSAIARSIAFAVVGLPVFTGLALYTRRLLKTTPSERHSLGWIGYLTVALIGSLIFVMSFSIAFVGELLTGGGFETTSFISMLVWGSVWIAHWWIADRIHYTKEAFLTVFEEVQRPWFTSLPGGGQRVEILDASALAPGLVIMAGVNEAERNFIRVIDRQGNVVVEVNPSWFEVWGTNTPQFPEQRIPQCLRC